MVSRDSSFFRNARVYFLATTAYWGIILFGYDIGIAGGVVAMPYFMSVFGISDGNGHTDTTRKDEVSGNVVAFLQAGAFFGALGSAPISSRFGRKKTLIGFTLLFLVGAILTAVAGADSAGLALIYSGRVISGVGVGAISAVAPTYVAECSPKEVRGRITGLFQVFVAIGAMISYFVNYGVSLYITTGATVWRIAFSIQLIPAAIMALGLLFCRESPRWLASVGRNKQALSNLAYLRKTFPEDPETRAELAEIEAAIEEDKRARAGLSFREAFLGPGNWIRFVIAIVIFILQQFSGQNSVSYYAPQVFDAIGYHGTSTSLFASGIYGVIKVVATAIYIAYGVEILGRKLSLMISSFGMGVLFFIIGALLYRYPPPAHATSPPPASQAMAGLLYIYCCLYSIGVGPIPWIYVSDIFPTRTRHYGLATASASQWLFNFVVAKITPIMETALDWKLFFVFGTIDIGGIFVFACLLPETAGRSLEEMDIIFGAVSADERMAEIARAQRELDGSISEATVVARDSGLEEKAVGAGEQWAKGW